MNIKIFRFFLEIQNYTVALATLVTFQILLNQKKCDLLARMVFAPTEMSISTVTAIFGAPVMIAVMLKQRQERY